MDNKRFFHINSKLNATTILNELENWYLFMPKES